MPLEHSVKDRVGHSIKGTHHFDMLEWLEAPGAVLNHFNPTSPPRVDTLRLLVPDAEQTFEIV